MMSHELIIFAVRGHGSELHWSTLSLSPCATACMQMSLAIEDERKQQGEIINSLVGVHHCFAVDLFVCSFFTYVMRYDNTACTASTAQWSLAILAGRGTFGVAAVLICVQH